MYGVELPGAVGRAGMAAIARANPESELDLDQLLRHARAELPAYAIPIFLRLTGPIEVTGTFKHRKVAMRDQGYNPGAGPDPIYVLLPKSDAYQRVTPELHDRIVAGDFSW